MSPLILALKIGSIVIAMIILLRLKVNLSLTIFLLSVYTVVLFQVNAKAALAAAGETLVEAKTLQLIVIICMVLYVAEVQKAKKMFDRLISSLNSMIRDSRFVAMIGPAIIGLLPMLGGALMSAPLVDVSTKKMNMEAEFKTFINYWFRHIWEFVWPIYAALPIFSTLSGIPLKTIILYQAPFTILNIFTGLTLSAWYFKKHHIKREKPGKITSFYQTLKDLFEGVWPILSVILLFFVLSIPLYISITLVAVILTAVKRLRPKEISDMLFSKSMGTIILLIASVMVFKRMIEVSNAFKNLAAMEVSVGMVVALSFLVSFTMGILTGVNNAFIVIAYPILLPLIQKLTAGHPDHYVLLSVYVYVIGFAGILLSPLHLCLILTNEYFKSSLYKVYRYLGPLGLILAAASTALVLILA
jgi:integral membrane protein (TIGR00529 family)